MYVCCMSGRLLHTCADEAFGREMLQDIVASQGGMMSQGNTSQPLCCHMTCGDHQQSSVCSCQKMSETPELSGGTNFVSPWSEGADHSTRNPVPSAEFCPMCCCEALSWRAGGRKGQDGIGWHPRSCGGGGFQNTEGERDADAIECPHRAGALPRAALSLGFRANGFPLLCSL